MKKTIVLSICLLTMLLACHKNRSAVNQIKDGDMSLGISRLKNGEGNSGTLDFAIRLISNKQLLADKDKSFRNSLWYSMDSCFYLMKGQRKIYSAIVQPIANGVAGTFEYMLSFNEEDLKAGNWSLIYDDRYLNHKKYTLSVPEE
ncbi:hypothetical protein SAMN05216490_0136 [Mucilaginibacter mallensis]|uniref:Uncharacterized protein n=1 Tax=Mucilaginibacter mallensis TaxID=652787 RepID=A0A1H1MQM2_MUCMA|nr:hypothetical protein [Mucilaginibacter mallensis]SDR88900.1 hypothetical protein SAMN05216490_0136 [Mucilaginibacter mallensis]